MSNLPPEQGVGGWRGMSSRYAEKLERELSIANQQAHDSIVECARLLAENQRLADRAVCSGCGSDVDESGICPYEGCDDGRMIPASDLPGALREACDAQTERWKEYAEEFGSMRAENQRLREALERIAAIEEAFGDIRDRSPRGTAAIAREALAGDAE